jgi:hypothetical protein
MDGRADEIEFPALTTAEVTEVLRHLGYASWIVQMLEDTVATYLVVVHQLDPADAVRGAEARFEKASKQTLGGLLKAIRDHDAPDPLVEHLDWFVDDRNWLAHRVFRECWKTIRDPEVALALTFKLEGMADQALQLSKEFGAALDEYVLAHGVTKERLDRTAREILEHVRAGE